MYCSFFRQHFVARATQNRIAIAAHGDTCLGDYLEIEHPIWQASASVTCDSPCKLWNLNYVGIQHIN
jgi:hypothetical protein